MKSRTSNFKIILTEPHDITTVLRQNRCGKWIECMYSAALFWYKEEKCSLKSYSGFYEIPLQLSYWYILIRIFFPWYLVYENKKIWFSQEGIKPNVLGELCFLTFPIFHDKSLASWGNILDKLLFLCAPANGKKPERREYAHKSSKCLSA